MELNISKENTKETIDDYESYSIHDKIKYYEMRENIYEMLKEQIPKFCKINIPVRYQTTQESIINEPIFRFESHIVSFSFDRVTQKLSFFITDWDEQTPLDGIKEYHSPQELPFDEGILYFNILRNICNTNNVVGFLDFIQGQHILSKCPYEYKSFLIATIENIFYELEYSISTDNQYIICLPLNQ
jgi:hypothetical protein